LPLSKGHEERVMLKIIRHTNGARTVIEAVGPLRRAAVSQMEQCWQEIRRNAPYEPVGLVITQVPSVDDRGRDLLSRMYQWGVEFVAVGTETAAIVEEIKQAGRVQPTA
jgi:hypothetical protein